MGNKAETRRGGEKREADPSHLTRRVPAEMVVRDDNEKPRQEREKPKAGRKGEAANQEIGVFPRNCRRTLAAFQGCGLRNVLERPQEKQQVLLLLVGQVIEQGNDSVSL